MMIKIIVIVREVFQKLRREKVRPKDKIKIIVIVIIVRFLEPGLGKWWMASKLDPNALFLSRSCNFAV